MKVIVSRHAQERLKERCGLNKKSIQRMTEKAYTNGISRIEMNGRLHKWATSIARSGVSNATNVKLYGDKLFLFDRAILVTVIQVPPNILKDIDKMIRKEKKGREKEIQGNTEASE